MARQTKQTAQPATPTQPATLSPQMQGIAKARAKAQPATPTQPATVALDVNALADHIAQTSAALQAIADSLTSLSNALRTNAQPATPSQSAKAQPATRSKAFDKVGSVPAMLASAQPATPTQAVKVKPVSWACVNPKNPTELLDSTRQIANPQTVSGGAIVGTLTYKGEQVTAVLFPTSEHAHIATPSYLTKVDPQTATAIQNAIAEYTR